MEKAVDVLEHIGFAGKTWDEVLNEKLDSIGFKPNQETQKTQTKATYTCPICKDNGYLFKTGEDGYEYSVKCECLKRKILETRIKKSGIAPELLEKSFDDYKVGDIQQLIKAKGMAMDYAENFLEFEHNRENSFLLCGQVGAGKTHLGVAICNRLIKDGIEVIYIAYRKVMTRLKQNVGSKGKDDYQAEIDRYISARVLYIDDFLKGGTSESDINIMYEVINGRYMRKSPTIISTEKTPMQLIQFDEAIGSRIVEMSKGRTVIFKGKELNHRY